MKQSEKALISAVGVLAGLVVASVVFSPVSVSNADLNDLEGLYSSTQELSGFNRIDIQGDWQVTVTQGDEWVVKWSDPDIKITRSPRILGSSL